MAEITLKDIKKAQKEASEKAIRLNRALGLPYLVVKDSKLVSIDASGGETVIGEPRFGTKKVSRKRFRLDEKKEI